MQDAQWWYANSRQSEGPVDLAGLRRLQQDGTVNARTLLWREDGIVAAAGRTGSVVSAGSPVPAAG